MSRGDVLRDARPPLLLGLSGWAVGAVLVARFATGSLQSDLDLVFLAVGVWVTVPSRPSRPLACCRTAMCDAQPPGQDVPRLGRDRPGHMRRDHRHDARHHAGLVHHAGLDRALPPHALRRGGRHRPPAPPDRGRPPAAVAASSRVRFGLLGGALAVFATALFISDALLANGGVVAYACDASMPADLCAAIQPTQPVLGAFGWVMFSVFAVGALVAFAFDLVRWRRVP